MFINDEIRACFHDTLDAMFWMRGPSDRERILALWTYQFTAARTYTIKRFRA